MGDAGDGGVARDARKAGTAFRCMRPLIAARRSRDDRMLTSAPNECSLKGGTRKHLHHQAERISLAFFADSQAYTERLRSHPWDGKIVGLCVLPFGMIKYTLHFC